MSIVEAWIGAKSQLASIKSFRQRAKAAVGLTSVLATELVGIFGMAPYAYRARQLFFSLPRPEQDEAAEGVRLLPSLPYATRPRTYLDVYLPPPHHQQQPVPVVLYCHGGVWASGDTWHYSPMGSSLAGLGALVLVMTHTLYPDAMVDQMVTEVSAALTWALDNAPLHGGDPTRCTLVGHSAGAHLCMMALLRRAAAAHEAQGSPAAASAAAPESLRADDASLPAPVDTRAPAQFVGISGVYDIGQHYEYEKGRNVHGISTLERAMGGPGGFACMSPTLLLHPSLAPSTSSAPSPSSPATSSCSGSSLVGPWSFPSGAAAHLPPVVLASSDSDRTVPCRESDGLESVLGQAGVQVRHLRYPGMGHGDFVVDWPGCTPPRAGGAPSEAGVERQQQLADLSGFGRDLVQLVTST